MGANNAWAFGSASSNEQRVRRRRRIETGKNRTGASLSGIALIPGTKSLWADGAAGLKTGSNASIWAYGSI